ncbi:endonuclease/exonuclease/phosphatase family protein [Arthrobacter sp. NPDC093139]|uniref:endonuclease/exonuclease/phosphatase family protein n=1 Tax=Arthrobacter sp. NPDC093139 TaxID=3363945 RepID=UPI00382B1A3E
MTAPSPGPAQSGPALPQPAALPHGALFVWRVLALAVMVPVASLSIFRAVPGQWPTPVVQLLSFTPWLVVPAVLGLGLALAGRRTWITVVAALLLSAQLFWLFPLDAGRAIPDASRPSTELTAMNINSQFGEADAAEVVRLVRENGVELLAVQEHTQGFEDRLAAEGLGSLLPNRVSSPTDDGAGSALYAAYPMEPVGLLPDTPFQMPTVRLTVQAAGRTSSVEVTNVHALPPVGVRIAQWRSDLAALGRLAQDGSVAQEGRVAEDGSVSRGGTTVPDGAPAVNRLLIGDFNATYDHSEFRALLDGGPGAKLVDVGTAAGRRLTPTWPMEGVPLPGIAIDHLVTSPQIVNSGYAAHRVPGTDHAAVLATLGIPAGD